MLPSNTLCVWKWQNPGHRRLVQRYHHPPDDVQHLRVPGGPRVSAAGEIQGSAGVFGSLPDPQHLSPQLGVGTFSHSLTAQKYQI